MNFSPDEYSGEVVIADVTTPLWHLTGAVASLLLATGLCSIVLGVFDRPVGDELFGVALPEQWRVGVLIIWAVWVLIGFILPVARSLAARTVITNQRIIQRPAGLFVRSHEVSMRHVIGVDRRSSDLYVIVYGGGDPLVLEAVPHPKELARRIRWSAGLS